MVSGEECGESRNVKALGRLPLIYQYADRSSIAVDEWVIAAGRSECENQINSSIILLGLPGLTGDYFSICSLGKWPVFT
jgi:hypothetical protein